MPSPIYNTLNQNGMLAQFKNFSQAFRGDPKAKVQELLNTGKMTQEQYNALTAQAQELMRMIK